MSKTNQPDIAALMAQVMAPAYPVQAAQSSVYASAFTAAVQLVSAGLGANKFLANELRARAQTLNDLADLVACADPGMQASDAEAGDAEAAAEAAKKADAEAKKEDLTPPETLDAAKG